MCRKIIEYHGGRIWLDTEYQGGTRFRFTLPALDKDSGPAADSAAEPAADELNGDKLTERPADETPAEEAKDTDG